MILELRYHCQKLYKLATRTLFSFIAENKARVWKQTRLKTKLAKYGHSQGLTFIYKKRRLSMKLWSGLPWLSVKKNKEK